MRGQTIQAKELGAELRALGLRQRGGLRDFSVRTETYRRNVNGQRFNEYGPAHASLYTKHATEIVAANADKIAEKGYSVTVFRAEGRIVMVRISTAWNPARRATIHNLDTRPTNAAIDDQGTPGGTI